MKEAETEGEERIERRKERLTAPLLPSAIMEVRTRRGGGAAAQDLCFQLRCTSTPR